jgi:hypothetical protein
VTRKTGGSNPGPRRKSIRNASNYLDDDDFSVAPSMDQDVKSVVSVVFDDVYKRGRKVCCRTLSRPTFCFSCAYPMTILTAIQCSLVWEPLRWCLLERIDQRVQSMP